MKNENNLVPRLRFPEFKNDGEWKESLLSEISPVIFDGTHQTPTYTEEGIPFFSVENIISGIAIWTPFITLCNLGISVLFSKFLHISVLYLSINLFKVDPSIIPLAPHIQFW